MNREREECGAQMSNRIPDAPVDQWETATCIQEHDRLPADPGTIHDSGDGYQWVELHGFTEFDDETRALLAEIARRP